LFPSTPRSAPAPAGAPRHILQAVGGFEIVEHTADVGIRASGATLEETFEQATLGLAEIMGLRTAQRGADEAISVEADDLGALLVDWLSEVLYLHEVRDALLACVQVDEVVRGRATGHVELSPRRSEAVGTQVKAITYHQLMVEQTRTGWGAQVYVDV
jgi:SHS2 domain-containing protein